MLHQHEDDVASNHSLALQPHFSDIASSVSTHCMVYAAAAWRRAQEAAEAARKIEHEKWALAQRLGKEADEATAERLSVMRERVSELKEEMGTVKEEITVSSSSSSTRVSSHTKESSSSNKVDVNISGKGDKGAKVKVAVEE